MPPSLYPIPQTKPHDQHRQHAVPLIWHKVAGTLKGLEIDGVEYQRKSRSTWGKRLTRQIKLGTKKRGR